LGNKKSTFAMLRLTQKRFLKPTQHVYLTDDGFVEVTIKRVLSQREFKFPLSDISPNSSRQKSFSQGGVAGAFILGIFAFISLVPGLTETDWTVRVGYFISTAIWLSALCVACVFIWFTRTDIVAYFHKHSGNALLTLYSTNPDKATFDAFLSEFDSRLQSKSPKRDPETFDFDPKYFSNN
jgi:hypothetical protein